jgi:hypothetical protein
MATARHQQDLEYSETWRNYCSNFCDMLWQLQGSNKIWCIQNHGVFTVATSVISYGNYMAATRSGVFRTMAYSLLPYAMTTTWQQQDLVYRYRYSETWRNYCCHFCDKPWQLHGSNTTWCIQNHGVFTVATSVICYGNCKASTRSSVFRNMAYLLLPLL